MNRTIGADVKKALRRVGRSARIDQTKLGEQCHQPVLVGSGGEVIGSLQYPRVAALDRNGDSRELEHFDVVETITDGNDLRAVDSEMVDDCLDAERLVDPGEVQLTGGIAHVGYRTGQHTELGTDLLGDRRDRYW